MIARKRYNLTLAQAAEQYGTSVRTLRRRIDEGVLVAVHIGGGRAIRVCAEDWDALHARSRPCPRAVSLTPPDVSSSYLAPPPGGQPVRVGRRDSGCKPPPPSQLNTASRVAPVSRDQRQGVGRDRRWRPPLATGPPDRRSLAGLGRRARPGPGGRADGGVGPLTVGVNATRSPESYEQGSGTDGCELSTPFLATTTQRRPCRPPRSRSPGRPALHRGATMVRLAGTSAPILRPRHADPCPRLSSKTNRTQ